MNGRQLLLGIGFIDERFIHEAEYKTNIRHFPRLWHVAAAAACFLTALGLSVFTIPNLYKKKFSAQPNNPNGVIAYNTSNILQSALNENGKKVQVSMSNVYVNNIKEFADSSRMLPDISLYSNIKWSEKDICNYFGRNVIPPYIPKELIASPNNNTSSVFVNEGNQIIEDTIWLQFYTDYYEDGSPKPADNTSVYEGFTITASKLGILNDCIYDDSTAQAKTTNIKGINIIIGYQNSSFGPYDEKTHEPAGYYDTYVVTFSLDDTEYQFIFTRMRLEEIIKIVASFITGIAEIELVN